MKITSILSVPIVATLFAASFLPTPSMATDVSGLIDVDTLWNLAGSPYIVTGNTLVDDGVTLTIQPGVEMRLDQDCNLRVHGHIQAIGNNDNAILFTSNQILPQMSDWSGITVVNNTGSELRWIVLEYSNTGIFIDAGTNNVVSHSIIRHTRDGMQIAGPSTVNNMHIYDCQTGVHMFNTDAISFVDNTLEDMEKGISIEGYSNPTISYCNFLQVLDYAVYIPHNTDGLIEAQSNYWGADTTAEMISKGPDANIEAIWDFYDNPTQAKVVYDNWLDAPNEDAYPHDDSLPEVWAVPSADASVYGARNPRASKVLNSLSMLLVPVGAGVLFRAARRRI